MKCSCPKCSSNINIDEPAVPEKGNFSRCPDCNSRFWLHREPFQLRAYKKDREVVCYNCGEEVGPAIYCQSCYAPFPDYWVVQTSRPARRKSTYKADFSISLPGLKFKKTKTVEKFDLSPKKGMDLEQIEGIDLEPEVKTGPAFNKIYVTGLALLLIVGLIFGGSKLFKGNENHEAFTKAYIVTLYGVTAGADYNIEKLTQISSGTPLSSKDAQLLEKMKINIDNHRQKLTAPSENFIGSLEVLDGVYQAYADLHVLTTSTAVVTASFREKFDLLTSDLNQAKQKLKMGLPDELMGDVKEATNKYKSLGFMKD